MRAEIAPRPTGIRHWANDRFKLPPQQPPSAIEQREKNNGKNCVQQGWASRARGPEKERPPMRAAHLTDLSVAIGNLRAWPIENTSTIGELLSDLLLQSGLSRWRYARWLRPLLQPQFWS